MRLSVGIGNRFNTYIESASYLLDTYSAFAAYSTRQLSSTATNCMIVTEDSGGTEAIIGFSAGWLDEASVATHCGASTGSVAQWYDQGGSGYHATQATDANQPEIYNGTVIITSNGNPTLFYNDNTKVLLTSSGFTIMTAKRHSTFMVDEIITGSAMPFSAYANANWAHSLSDSSPSNVLFDGSWRLAVRTELTTNVQYIYNNIRHSDTLLSTSLNGNTDSVAVGDVSYTTAQMGIGRHPTTGTGLGTHKLCEVIHYIDDQTVNQSQINDNQNEAFSAYV